MKNKMKNIGLGLLVAGCIVSTLTSCSEKKQIVRSDVYSGIETNSAGTFLYFGQNPEKGTDNSKTYVVTGNRMYKPFNKIVKSLIPGDSYKIYETPTVFGKRLDSIVSVKN